MRTDGPHLNFQISARTYLGGKLWKRLDERLAAHAEVHPGEHPERVSASSGQPSPGSRAWETPADSRVMQALVSRCWRADWPTQHLHAGDVDWWSVHAFGRTPGLEGRVRLWFAGEPDATELVGFAWYGLPNEADLIVAPAHRGPAVIGAMIDWVEAQIPRYGSTPATRLGGLDVDAVETPAQVDPANDTPAPADGPAMTARVWSVVEDEAAVRALAELGFEEGSEPGFAHFTGRIDALDLSAPVLPDGYELGDDRHRRGRRREGRLWHRGLPRFDDDRGEVRVLPIDAVLPSGARHDRPRARWDRGGVRPGLARSLDGWRRARAGRRPSGPPSTGSRARGLSSGASDRGFGSAGARR